VIRQGEKAIDQFREVFPFVVSGYYDKLAFGHEIDGIKGKKENLTTQ
jgi:hypothetical protein